MSGSGLSFRRAQEMDLEPAARIMRAAFKMWEPIGFDPSLLTEEAVARFLLRDGWVAEHEGRIAGAACLNIVEPEIAGDEMKVARAHRIDSTVLLDPADKSFLAEGSFAYFYSLAVDPDFSKRGFGEQILTFIEAQARGRGCRGLLLETAERSGWLVRWYERSGFRVVGRQARNPEPLIFMLKRLRRTG